jgi:hypothetical protein
MATAKMLLHTMFEFSFTADVQDEHNVLSPLVEMVKMQQQFNISLKPSLVSGSDCAPSFS